MGYDRTNSSVTHALLCEGASPYSVLILNRIVGQCRAYGVCTMAAGTFAAELCITKRGFWKMRDWLEQNGYIQITKSINTTSNIRITQKTKNLFISSGAYSETELNGVNCGSLGVNGGSLHAVNRGSPKQRISREEAPPLQAGRASLLDKDEWYAE